MKHSIRTSDGQISLFGEDESMFSPAASPASRSRRQAKEKEPMTTDTSGRLCLQQFGKSVPDGSWARTFTELLIGMPGWYSSRCALTWKLKATKSNRSYFQLAVSMLPTADTEPSLLPTVTTTNASQGLKSNNNAGKPLLPRAALLLKTPTAMDGSISSGKKNPVSGSSGTLAQEIMSGFVYKRGILPTPEANNYKNGHRTVSPRIERKMAQGWTVGLNDLATLKLLPTPTATDWKPSFSPAGMLRKDGKTRDDLLRNIPVMIGEHCQQRSGKTSQLNPLFVEEMMGFPNGWILLPFLKGSSDLPERILSIDGERNP